MRKINIGDNVSIKKKFTADEVQEYASISKDTNPVHFDQKYASETFFKKPIVHGLLVSSLFGGLLGSKLPGKGTIHIGQNLKFIKPVYIEEEVIAEIKIINIRQDKPIITLSTKCYKENKELAIDGEAIVYYKGNYFK